MRAALAPCLPGAAPTALPSRRGAPPPRRLPRPQFAIDNAASAAPTLLDPLSSTSAAAAAAAAAAVLDPLSSSTPLLLPALAGAGITAALAIAATSAASSGRVDFATTARLEAVTKPGQGGGGRRTALLLTQPDNSASRALFLLPDRVTDVTVVAPGLDAGWWAKAGAQAGVRVSTVDSLQGLASLPPASFDVALVRGGVLASLSAADPSGRARTSALTSIARALAPGCAAVVVERLAGVGGPVAGAVRAVSRGAGSGLAEADLEVLLEGVTASAPVRGAKPRAGAPPAFARVAVDTVAGGADPHALIVAAVAEGAAAAAGGAGPAAGAPRGGGSGQDEAGNAVEERLAAGRRKSGASAKKKGFSSSG